MFEFYQSRVVFQSNCPKTIAQISSLPHLKEVIIGTQPGLGLGLDDEQPELI